MKNKTLDSLNEILLGVNLSPWFQLQLKQHLLPPWLISSQSFFCHSCPDGAEAISLYHSSWWAPQMRPTLNVSCWPRLWRARPKCETAGGSFLAPYSQQHMNATCRGLMVFSPSLDLNCLFPVIFHTQPECFFIVLDLVVSFPIYGLTLCPFLFFFFFELNPWHMKVSGPGVESEPPLLAYATATVMLDPSRICNLCSSFILNQILNPLIKAGVKPISSWTQCQVLNQLSHDGNSELCPLYLTLSPASLSFF